MMTLMDSYPQLYKNFWQERRKKFPNEPYVDFLTGRENYLIQNKQFYITFNIGRQGYSRYIYEKSTLSYNINCHIYEIQLTHRYVIQSYNLGKIFSYHDSIDLCLEYIGQEFKNHCFVIIDLSLMTILFDQHGTLKKDSTLKFFKTVIMDQHHNIRELVPDGWTPSSKNLF